ncbi:MAG: AMP-binding protein [Nitriliruptor sp.]|uniref:AMP-binding protein n=1 Tax=Nitriliruptor sp. TaxID=2448056 RepID=UPI0034A082DD
MVRARRPSLPEAGSLPRPWVRAYPPGVPPTYRLPDVALPRFLDDAARDFPDRDALLVEGRTTSFVDLRDRVDRVATALAAAGIGAGDRVLVALPLGEPAPVVLFAVWRLGAVAVPVDPDTRADLLAGVARDAAVAAAVGTRWALSSLQGEDQAPEVVVEVRGDEWIRRRLRDRLPRPRLPDVRSGRGLRPAVPGDTVRLADLLTEETSGRRRPAGPSPSDPAVIAYRPRARELRGVVLSHANLVANAFQGRLWVPDVQAGRERMLVTDPLHLTVPLTLGVLTGVLAAATLILVDRPDAGELTATIERDRPTLWPTGPDRLTQLLGSSDRRRDLSSLRVIVTGGAPLSPQVAADVERRTGGARVREGYGLAEASPLTHAQPVYGRVADGSIGLPVTDTVALLVEPDDLTTPVPPGTPGMLLVAGPQVADGYWQREEATTSTFRDGWLVTGDLATADEGGVYTLLGRASEVVRRDGELVAPHAVESVLVRHPSVLSAAVVTDDAGAQLLAGVVAAKRAKVDVEGLFAHCHALLPPPAVPDHIELLDELPVDVVGQLDRDALRRRLTGKGPS